ncbi:MAG: hypothetical protein JNM81_05685 [Rhodospirillaceae bacterium]|nr:hypothetical protein [Rhodospirillaceae bacterium]
MLPQIAALAAALIVALGLRLGLKTGRGQHYAGVGIALGFMIGLSLVAGFSWGGYGPIDRIGHIALGAALVGFALDVVQPSWGRWALLTVFSLGCAWASALNGLKPADPPTALQLGLVVLLGVVWLGLVVRLSHVSPHKATSFIVVIAAITGLALLASITHDSVLTNISLCLLGAVFAFAVVAAVFSVELNYAAMVPAAACILAIAWGLSQRQPETIVGLPILALVLFAERTARRMPLPQGGRIAAYLYLAGLAGCCTIPIMIAALLVSAGTSA